MKHLLKKVASIVCALAVLLGLGTNAFAANSDSFELRKNEIIAELMQDGLSRKDAEYYAELDTMIRKMELSGETIQLDAVDATETRVALANQVEFRERVLQKDPAAIKCALSMSSNLFLGQEDMKDLTRTYQGQNEYTIIYPDGSKIQYAAGSVEAADENRLYASGFSTETFGSGTNTSYSNYDGWGEYVMSNPSNYSKNRVDCEYTYSATGVTMNYVEGNQSSYGFVLISNSNGGEISREKSTSTAPAEANNQVVFQVSGSLGVGKEIRLVGVDISVSIAAGANWTQTVYFRVTKNGNWSAVATTYT